jgi:hypothetical protein
MNYNLALTFMSIIHFGGFLLTSEKITTTIGQWHRMCAKTSGFSGHLAFSEPTPQRFAISLFSRKTHTDQGKGRRFRSALMGDVQRRFADSLNLPILEDYPE